MSKHGPQQLSAMDAIFLTQEAAYMPMHIGLLMFYTPPASSRGPVRFKDILPWRERPPEVGRSEIRRQLDCLGIEPAGPFVGCGSLYDPVAVPG